MRWLVKRIRPGTTAPSDTEHRGWSDLRATRSRDSVKPRLLEVVTVRRRATARRDEHVDEREATSRVGTVEIGIDELERRLLDGPGNPHRSA
jgi:hypothetical protein